MKTIYVSGVFDMFHYGHVRLLKKCEEIAYELMIKLREPVRLLIGVHNDADCANYKRKPIMSMNERSTSIIELIEWLGYRGLFVAVLIDAPLIETKEFYESKEIIKTVHAHKEENKKYNKYYEDAIKMGIFERLDYTGGISTSDLIDRCIDSTYECV